MTSYLTVPIHLDALVLEGSTEVVGPSLDITRAPWFGKLNGEAARDHFANTANVSPALRHDPMTPNNRFLSRGTHLHWALPDALTHGTTSEAAGKGHVARDGLWFPQAPNRWVVMRIRGGTLAAAWLVESDFVHPWNSGSEATAYPVLPNAAWPHPFANLGRSTPLFGPAPSDKSAARLADLDAPLTAIGPGDPTFAALYPACHSVFGLHTEEVPNAKVTYEVFGWYDGSQLSPFGDWLRLTPGARDRKDYIASVLAQHDKTPKRADQITNWTDATARAIETVFRNRSGLAIEPSVARAADCAGLVFYGTTTITPKGAPLPDPVVSRVSVGTSTSEAVAALVARIEGDDALEDTLEALEFGTELKDHRLDHGPKLAEARHSAGFSTTGKKTTWAVRAPEAEVSDPLKGTQPRHDEVHAQLPPQVAHLLNLLNIAQDTLDRAVDAARAARAALFADWQLYMQASYPEDDHADFALDVDVLRDVIVSGSVEAFETAEAELDPARQGSAGARFDLAKAALEAELAAFAASHPQKPKLTVIPVPGPRFNVPNDPVVAIEGAAALVETRRHGNDGRLREDGLLECKASDIAALPGFKSTAAELLALRKAIRTGARPAFKAICDTTQIYAAWNPILLEWQASVRPLLSGSNLRGKDGRYDPAIIEDQFTLGEEACDLRFTGTRFPDQLATPYHVSGRALLHGHGTDLLQERINDFVKTMSGRQSRLKAQLAKVTITLNAVNAPQSPSRIVSTSLGGFTERLLMRHVEPQLPISDPLGFDGDKARAAQIRDHVGNPNGLWSADTEAPFLPLRITELRLAEGRIIDTFGQFVPWHPGGRTGSDIVPAAQLRHGTGARVFLPPRSAQPAQLSFRWLDADDDLVESNDHPASTPLCGWLVPNDLDRNILVYDAPGRLLGLVDLNGIWRPAPGDAAAPAGPGLIQNLHLSRVVGWIVANGSAGFMTRLLDTFDTSLSAIDPKDYTVQNAAALLVGRPIAVARSQIDLRLHGPPASDLSQEALARRISGQPESDHGFGAVRFPIRIGEHKQLNDGLVGYFIDSDRGGKSSDVLYAPQAAPVRGAPQIKTYDKGTPLTLPQSFDDPAIALTLLLDPRCPVHATTGILPTKSISIPRDQFMPALRNIEFLFAAMPLLTPPEALHLPLPGAPDQTWSWIAMEDGGWTETAGVARVTLADLRKARPGRVALGPAGATTLLDGDANAKTGEAEAPAADVLWQRLLAAKWIEETGPGIGLLHGPETPTGPDLGLGFPMAETERLLSKIATGLRPADHTATFGNRAVARDGWLKLKPRHVAPDGDTDP